MFSGKRAFILICLLCAIRTIGIGKIDLTPEERAWINNHKVIYHGYEPNWPPFEMYQDGTYVGIVSDYLRIVEKETGLTFKAIENITWEESLAKLKSGEIDMVPCAGITDERKEFATFTKPYISSPMIILTRKDYEFVGDLKDLYGKTVALPKSYYTAEMIQKDHPQIKIKFTESLKDAMIEVSLGNADAFVGNLVVCSYYIENEGLSNLKVAAPTDYQKSHIGFAARKDWPELISIVQKVHDQISFKERNQILQKWIFVRYEHGIDKRKIVKGVLVFSGIIVIILLWNWSLQRQIKKRKKAEKNLVESLVKINQQHEEKKTLLREIHHRVKNNLHIVSGMIKLQALESDDKKVETELNDAIKRIRSMALIHEKMYQTDDLENVDLKEYCESLIRDILNSFAHRDSVTLNVESYVKLINTEPLASLALILNELVTNTLKYGFKDRSEGTISLSFHSNGNRTTEMVYHDNGTWIEPTKKSSFGLSMIDIFTEQLEGSCSTDKSDGTKYTFSFKSF